jgi:hypothetical protein
MRDKIFLSYRQIGFEFGQRIVNALNESAVCCVHSRGAVSWCQLMAASGGSQGFPSVAARMASSAVVPWAAAVSRWLVTGLPAPLAVPAALGLLARPPGLSRPRSAPLMKASRSPCSPSRAGAPPPPAAAPAAVPAPAPHPAPPSASRPARRSPPRPRAAARWRRAPRQVSRHPANRQARKRPG